LGQRATTKVPQIILQWRHYTLINGLFKLVALESLFSLIELAPNAPSHGIAVPVSGFAIDLFDQPIRSQEIGIRVWLVVVAKILGLAHLLQRLVKTQLD
jgi:hypothetical protein